MTTPPAVAEDLATRLADLALAAAKAGGRQVTDRLGGAVAQPVPAGEDRVRDPVTAADLASDAAIREVIGSSRADDSWLSEESGLCPGTSGLRWVVDPLDGTVNVTHGIARFAISVAVESERTGAVLAAAVLQPASGEWLALRAGAVNASGRRHPEVTGTDPSRALVSFAVPSAGPARQAAYRSLAAVAAGVQDLRNFGSTVCDLAGVADGHLDGFVTVEPKPWDVAAGAALVAAAGGTVGRWRRSDGLAVLVAGGARVVEALRGWMDA